jgi:hypothetical protein
MRQFLSTYDLIANAFSRRLSQDTIGQFHTARQAFTTWTEVVGVAGDI